MDAIFRKRARASERCRRGANDTTEMMRHFWGSLINRSGIVEWSVPQSSVLSFPPKGGFKQQGRGCRRARWTGCRALPAIMVIILNSLVRQEKKKGIFQNKMGRCQDDDDAPSAKDDHPKIELLFRVIDHDSSSSLRFSSLS